MRIIFLLIIFSVSTFAQNAGLNGLSFLKVGASAKSIGTSDIGLLSDDISSVYYNPAAVNLQKNSSVMFTHQAWIQDVSSEVINAGFSFWDMPFTLGVNTTKVKGFEVRTIPSDTPDSEFDADFFFASLSTGANIYADFSVGFTIKYLYESMLTDDASGFGYDFGMMYKSILPNMNLGLSLRNLGSMNKLRDEETQLPSDIIVNATYFYRLEDSSFDFKPVVGIQKYLDVDEVHIHAGTSIEYDEVVNLHLGYVSGYESKGLSAGLGFLWKNFTVEYAITPFSYGLGNASTITLLYNFK